MATESRTPNLAVVPDPVEAHLRREPYAFEFFQAVQLLERLSPETRARGPFRAAAHGVRAVQRSSVAGLSGERDTVLDLQRERASADEREFHGSDRAARRAAHPLHRVHSAAPHRRRHQRSRFFRSVSSSDHLAVLSGLAEIPLSDHARAGRARSDPAVSAKSGWVGTRRAARPAGSAGRRASCFTPVY